MPGWIAFLLVLAWLIHWIGWYIVAEDECWSVAGFMWIAFLTMPFAPITAPILLVKSIQIVRLNNYSRDWYTGLFSVDPLDTFTEEELVRWNELQNSPEVNGSQKERKICSQKLHEIYTAALHRPKPEADLTNGRTFEDLRKEMATRVLELEANREKQSLIDGVPYEPLFEPIPTERDSYTEWLARARKVMDEEQESRHTDGRDGTKRSPDCSSGFGLDESDDLGQV